MKETVIDFPYVVLEKFRILLGYFMVSTHLRRFRARGGEVEMGLG
jgi:hypothetical protein